MKRKTFRENLMDVANGHAQNKDPLTSLAPTEKQRALASRLGSAIKPAGFHASDSPALAGKFSPAVYGLWG